MGRFVHEAVAVDPATGIVYETEDSGASGFYRFTPAERGQLARGGVLEMLAVDGQAAVRHAQGPGAGRHLSGRSGSGSTIPSARITTRRSWTDSGVYQQGFAQGRRHLRPPRGRVCRPRQDLLRRHQRRRRRRAVRSGSTTRSRERLRLVFESPGAEVLDMPDNVAVSPRGGLVLCEDGPDVQFVRGLTVDGVDLRLRPEQRRAARRARPARRLPAAASSPAPSSAPTASGSSSTCRAPASPSRSRAVAEGSALRRWQ